MVRRATLYQHILSRVMKQNCTSLKKLCVNAPQWFGDRIGPVTGLHTQSALLDVLQSVDITDVFSITELVWSSDRLSNSVQVTQTINRLLPIKCPNLQRFSFSTSVQYVVSSQDSFGNTLHPNNFPTMLPCFESISQNPHGESLSIDFPACNLFRLREVQNIFCTETLKELMIGTLLSTDEPFRVPSHPNLSLTKLHLELTIQQHDAVEAVRESFEKLLVALFRRFVNIEEFELTVKHKDWWRYMGRYRFEKIEVNWQTIFAALFHQKTTAAISGIPVQKLQCLTLSQLSYGDAVRAINALRQYSYDTFFDLQRLNVMLRPSTNDGETAQHEYAAFIEHELIPFLNCDANNIKHVTLEFDTSYHPPSSVASVAPTMHFLSNLPSSLQCLDLTPPNISNIDLQVQEKDSHQLMVMLCKLLSEHTASSNLQRIILNDVRHNMTYDARKYLTFIFGFNHDIDLRFEKRLHLPFM